MEKVDILVIGGGMAGLMAALSAKAGDKEVLLISKHPIGRSGNTLVSGGGIAGATEKDENTAEAFIEDILKSGKGLAKQELVEMLANRSAEMIKRLSDFGVGLIREGENLRFRKPPGHSVARNIPTRWKGLSYLNRGLSFTLPLLSQCQKQEIRMVEGWEAVQLVKKAGRVIGAVFQSLKGEHRIIYAGNIILATGGAGSLFERTNNTFDIQGGGLALALQVGCTLQDMEQIQFYPTMMFEPLKMTVSNPLFGVGAVLRNKDGERFMSKYDAAGDLATRDNMARGIFLEIQAGNGVDGTVYFDCTGIPEATLQTSYSDFCSFLAKKNINPSKNYLRIAPCAHYTLGGVVMDAKCQTEVPGLLVAGEICGGIHGANRLSGVALMEACVTGWQAGETAVKTMIAPVIEDEFPMIFESSLSKSMLIRVRQILWEKASLMRNQKGLEEALDEVMEMQECLSKANEFVSNFLKIAEVILRSALFRQESRGAHYRSDFFEKDSFYDGNIVCRLKENQLTLELKPLD